MIKTALDIIGFLNTNFSFILALIVYTILAIALSKSIKKHANVYNWVFGVLGVAFAISPISRLCGVTLPFSIQQIPILGSAASELSSAANFIHPVIVIIMYMGAFSPKTRYIPRLMSIRKELSIIVGFPVIAHLAKRLFGTFPQAWSYFMNYEESVANPKVVSEVGSAITNAVLVLGIVMTVLFLVLWITSFDSVHKKLGAKRWKSVQKWSYGLYAMLFIHAVGLQLGGMISYNANQRIKQESAVVIAQESQPKEGHSHGEQGHSHGEQKGENQPEPQKGESQGSSKTANASSGQGGHSSHGKSKGFSFSDIEISRSTKAIVNILIYILVYSSYLYFRLKKAKDMRLKKRKLTTSH
ncbi:MAG: hypothetical protein R3Y04_01915 [Rikenellaceae bacterium]